MGIHLEVDTQALDIPRDKQVDIHLHLVLDILHKILDILRRCHILRNLDSQLVTQAIHQLNPATHPVNPATHRVSPATHQVNQEQDL